MLQPAGGAGWALGPDGRQVHWGTVRRRRPADQLGRLTPVGRHVPKDTGES